MLNQGTLELKHRHRYCTPANLQPQLHHFDSTEFGFLLAPVASVACFQTLACLAPAEPLEAHRNGEKTHGGAVVTYAKLSAGDAERSLFWQTQSRAPKTLERLAYAGMITVKPADVRISFPFSAGGLNTGGSLLNQTGIWFQTDAFPAEPTGSEFTGLFLGCYTSQMFAPTFKSPTEMMSFHVLH